MRFYYRELALRLYEEVSASSGALSGTNPLTDDLSNIAITELHPARLLALTWLAHASMMVTGYKLPYIDNGNSRDLTDDTDFLMPLTARSIKALAGIVLSAMQKRMTEPALS